MYVPLIDLHDVLRLFLLTNVADLHEKWFESEPEGRPYSWRIGASERICGKTSTAKGSSTTDHADRAPDTNGTRQR
jgi:hypothetical protein